MIQGQSPRGRNMVFLNFFKKLQDLLFKKKSFFLFTYKICEKRAFCFCLFWKYHSFVAFCQVFSMLLCRIVDSQPLKEKFPESPGEREKDTWEVRFSTEHHTHTYVLPILFHNHRRIHRDTSTKINLESPVADIFWLPFSLQFLFSFGSMILVVASFKPLKTDPQV